MSIQILNNLSLLQNAAPAAQGTVNGGRSSTAFAERLERALEQPGDPGLSATEQAQKLAEAMQLKMLRTTLSLAGDSPPDAEQGALFKPDTASIQALIRNYTHNQAESSRQPEQPGHAPSQLDEFSAAATITTPRPQSAGDTQKGWLEPIIAQASQRYGVDADLIRAVIKAESDFNPKAVSHAGAQGLMQLMPATARALGVSDPFDPEQNVMGGTRFLRDLLNRYHGDTDSALAAYNWGPGNVDRRPDRLPKETREYLTRVKQLYSNYSA